MIHFQEYKLPGFDQPVFVTRNEDWSGMAVIEWLDVRQRRVEIPARILLLLSFTETKKWVISEIEHALNLQMSDPVPRERKRKT